jgi:hypothetical protein
MTLLVDRSYGANESAYDTGISNGLTKWNVTPTTVWFDEDTYNYSVNDVHIKTEDLDWLGTSFRAATFLYDYHNLSDAHYCSLGDCDDPDGLAAHQPQRWWYAYVKLDTTGTARFLSYPPDTQAAVIAQELGHVLGLDDRPPNDNCSPAPSIMDSKCIQFHGVRDPQPIDTCMVNHAGWPVSPLMYGDAFDSQGTSLAYWTCSGGVP